MARYAGGSLAGHGFYWSAGAWDMAMVPAEGGLLPGNAARGYTHIPTFLFLLMAPIMGALYVVFLPFAGFALLASFLFKAIASVATGAFMRTAVLVSPHWAPGEAYLASRRNEKAAKAAKRRATGQ